MHKGPCASGRPTSKPDRLTSVFGYAWRLRWVSASGPCKSLAKYAECGENTLREPEFWLAAFSLHAEARLLLCMAMVEDNRGSLGVKGEGPENLW